MPDASETGFFRRQFLVSVSLALRRLTRGRALWSVCLLYVPLPRDNLGRVLLTRAQHLRLWVYDGTCKYCSDNVPSSITLLLLLLLLLKKVKIIVTLSIKNTAGALYKSQIKGENRYCYFTGVR